MEKFEEIKKKLKDSMTINGVVQKRYYHSLEVAKKALELNESLVHYDYKVSDHQPLSLFISLDKWNNDVINESQVFRVIGKELSETVVRNKKH